MFKGLHKDEEKIILQSRELFITYGIRSVSMDDISTNLGISKKTLYRFINDKEDLVDKVVTYSFSANATSIEKLLKPELNAIDEVLAIIIFFTKIHQSYSANMIFDLQKYYPNVYQKFKKGRTQKLTNFYTKNFKKGLKEGLYREDLNEEVILKIIILLSEIIIENDTLTLQEAKSPAFIMEFHTYHLYGIVSEKGYKYLQNELKNLK